MKKFITTLFFAAMTIVVSAQVSAVKLVDCVESVRLAMEIDDDGLANFYTLLYTVDYETEEAIGDFKYSIYGEGFTLLKSGEFKKMGYPESLSNITVECKSVFVTKNWFVKNDKWCFIFTQPTDQKDEYGNPIPEMVVIDEDGNLVCRLDEVFNKHISLYPEYFLDGVMYGKPYIVTMEFDGNYDEWMTVYEINATAGVQAVKVAQLNAYPNPLCGGQTLTVELDRPADNKTFLVITDMKGRQVARQRVENGAEKAVLNHSRFGHGQYIYTVIFGDGTSSSGKLLAD